MLEEFTAVHDRCLQAWADAVQSGDGSGLREFPGEGYQGFFGHGGAEGVEPVDRAEAVAGAGRLVGAFRGCSHRTGGRMIRMSGANEAVVTYERIFERGGAVQCRFLVLQAWRRQEGAWKVVRESAEFIGG